MHRPETPNVAPRRPSPAEKLIIAHELRETAWAIAAEWVRMRHPDLDEQAVQSRVRALFFRAWT
jgi:hypothetical protein